MITPRQFADLVSRDPALEATLCPAADEIPDRPQSACGAPLEMAAVVALFPLVVFLVKNIGLPWLYEAARFSELWRQKFHDWLDEQCRRYNMDPEALQAAGEALRKELEALTEKDVKKSWERLAELLKKE
jgi:hypothetical protein